jgi:SAM-dependent methyltransferase
MTWIYIVGLIVVLLGASVFFGAPYVPSRRRDMRRMFDELYPLSSDDVVFDAGSGDGVVLREVSRRGAKAYGYEISPIFWAVSKLLSAGYKNITIKLRNFWVSPFPDDVTFVYVFAVSRDGKRLVTKLQEERARIGHPFTVVCYGSPFKAIKPVKVFEAYHLYQF